MNKRVTQNSTESSLDKTFAETGGIKVLLQRAIDHVDKLHQALEEEQQALSSNNLIAFESSVESKISHTSSLETIEKAIYCLLDNSGYPMNKKGIADYIATLHDKVARKTIKNLWHKLAKALADCQDQNQINGRILNTASVNIRQALEILTGQRGKSKTYSAQGKQSKGDNSNSIAVA